MSVRIRLESLSGCSWNGCPSGRGIRNLHQLERLLQCLSNQGWMPFEVLREGAWRSTSTIEAVLRDIGECEPPVIRLLKDGTQTAAVRLAWGRGPANLVDDHTASSGFADAMEKAKAEVEHLASADLLDRLLTQLDESGSKNYQEALFNVTFGSDEMEAIVTLQRRDRPSPHQLRMLAEEERNRLRTDLVALQGVVRAVHEQFRLFGDRFPDGFDQRVFKWVEDAAAACHTPVEQDAPGTVH